MGGKRKKCRKERVGSVAANPDNLGSNKEAGGGVGESAMPDSKENKQADASSRRFRRHFCAARCCVFFYLQSMRVYHR